MTSKSNSNSHSNSNLFEELLQHNRDKKIYQQAIQYAFDYLDTVRDRNVFPTDSALAAMQELDQTSSNGRMPEHPIPVQDILYQLHAIGSPATVAQGGGRYFGFVNGGIIPGSLAARFMADAWDQNGGLYLMSPIAAKLEHLCEQWIIDLLGLPPETTAAGFVSGTSTATMVGLLTGRNKLLNNQGWNVAQEGLFGAPPIRVVASAESHSSIRKALAIIGIGQRQIEWVDTNQEGCLDLTKLPVLDNNTLVIVQAGNVNSGSFDPFRGVCEKAKKAGAWVHVDGAFGLWAAACASTKYLTEGIDLADSWSVDGHKTLNAPYDCGIIICKDRSLLVNALQATGSYLQYSNNGNRDNMLNVPEMSRRARGIELWALLLTLGRSGVDAMIDRLCQRARLFAKLLPEYGFIILNDVVFNQVVVACDTPELTEATLTLVQKSGDCWCGASNWHGQPVIRVSVCSWATTEEDVQISVRAFAKAYEFAKQQQDSAHKNS
jgi:glutamate/tyrosine decarboxylase-like PLP-dependent enzyme